jgi:hypothetical protein
MEKKLVGSGELVFQYLVQKVYCLIVAFQLDTSLWLIVHLTVNTARCLIQVLRIIKPAEYKNNTKILINK